MDDKPKKRTSSISLKTETVRGSMHTQSLEAVRRKPSRHNNRRRLTTKKKHNHDPVEMVLSCIILLSAVLVLSVHLIWLTSN